MFMSIVEVAVISVVIGIVIGVGMACIAINAAEKFMDDSFRWGGKEDGENNSSRDE